MLQHTAESRRRGPRVGGSSRTGGMCSLPLVDATAPSVVILQAPPRLQMPLFTKEQPGLRFPHTRLFAGSDPGPTRHVAPCEAALADSPPLPRQAASALSTSPQTRWLAGLWLATDTHQRRDTLPGKCNRRSTAQRLSDGLLFHFITCCHMAWMPQGWRDKWQEAAGAIDRESPVKRHGQGSRCHEKVL